MDQKIDNRTVFDRDQIGFSEAYYVLWNDPIQKLSMIVRYVLFNGPTEETKLAEVWAWFRDRSAPGKPDVAIRQRYHLDSANFSTDKFSLEIDQSGINDEKCWGVVKNNDDILSWEFDIADKNAVGINRLPGMEQHSMFPRFYSPKCKHKLSGKVVVGGTTYLLENVIASDGHYWNVHNMKTWNWCNCVNFKNEPDFLFEGIGIKFNDWGQASVWMSIQWEGKLYQSNFVDSIYNNCEINSALTSWELSMEKEDVRFVCNVKAKPEDMILIIHPLPDGNNLYTTISYNADMDIDIYKNEKETWLKVKTIEAPDTASFEVTKPIRNEKVTREFKIVSG